MAWKPPQMAPSYVQTRAPTIAAGERLTTSCKSSAATARESRLVLMEVRGRLSDSLPGPPSVICTAGEQRSLLISPHPRLCFPTKKAPTWFVLFVPPP